METTRRTFLKISPFLARAAAAAAARPDRDGAILVVLQLAGGNDGLNTVIPYEDDHYGRARTTLRLSGKQVHKIGSSLGFHPELDGFARLFKEGHLAIVHGVGYPNMNRDHQKGMQIWHTANPASHERDGWIGRVADQLSKGEEVPAAFVGQIAPPLAIHSRRAIVPAIHEAKDWTLVPGAGSTATTVLVPSPAFDGARRVAQVLQSGRSLPYPDLRLAQSFKSVAHLIRAEVGIRIFMVEHGGPSPGEFDNHSNQAGNHAESLRELGQSVAAFCDDLAADRLLDRVLLMTLSEFGRTLTENGRRGTGHGAAAPVFLAGGRVKGGFAGAAPNLADLENDAPKPQIDFRSVYATALESWLGIPPAPILGQFGVLDVV